METGSSKKCSLERLKFEPNVLADAYESNAGAYGDDADKSRKYKESNVINGNTIQKNSNGNLINGYLEKIGANTNGSAGNRPVSRAASDTRKNSSSGHGNGFLYSDASSSDHLSRKDIQIKKDLMKITDVPLYLRFNPFVLTGYRRPNLSFWESVVSLFYYHNETINILTHGKFFKN